MLNEYVLAEGQMGVRKSQREEERKEYVPTLNSKRGLLGADQLLLIKRCTTNFVGTSSPCRPLSFERPRRKAWEELRGQVP